MQTRVRSLILCCSSALSQLQFNFFRLSFSFMFFLTCSLSFFFHRRCPRANHLRRRNWRRGGSKQLTRPSEGVGISQRVAARVERRLFLISNFLHFTLLFDSSSPRCTFLPLVHHLLVTPSLLFSYDCSVASHIVLLLLFYI